MIYFQTEKFRIDLSTYGVTTTEVNDLFKDSINKSYSLPFTIEADSFLLEKLDLPTLKNIRNAPVKITGQFVLPNKHYNAILYLGEFSNNFIECTLTYGEAALPVYDTNIKDFPWPIITTNDLPTLAKETMVKSWPETGYNFPMVHRKEIEKDTNYDYFLGFINHFKDGNYLQNDIEIIEGEPVVKNENVMAPFPYFLEIIKFGFKQAGIKAEGEIFKNADLKRALYIPETYLEHLNNSIYQQYSFNNRTGVVLENSVKYNLYENSFTPNQEGTFEVTFRINLDPVLAQFFELSFYREDASTQERTLLTQYQSINHRVNLYETINVDVAAEEVGDPIVTVLKLRYTDIDISQFNSFEVLLQDGELNIFPETFSLSTFMPDMTFGEFLNELENWLNIEISVTDNLAILSFVQNSVFQKHTENHTHLEIPEPKVNSNANRFYKLSYLNEDRVFYTKDGQIFSDLEDEGNDVIEIDMKINPAEVKTIDGNTTAQAPEETSGLPFCLYGGTVDGKPWCNRSFSKNLSLQNVFTKYWQTWLNYRVNSYSYKETFECSAFEILDIENLSYKYNELHLIKQLKTKHLSETLVSVDIESETF